MLTNQHDTEDTEQGEQNPTDAVHLRVEFTLSEAARLSGISRNTLKVWRKRGLIPNTLSGWTTVALVLIGGAFRSARARQEYMGSTAVRKQMTALAERDDSELLDPSAQDVYTEERVAAIVNVSAPDEPISPETAEQLSQVLRRIDREHKAQVARERTGPARMVNRATQHGAGRE